MLRRLLLAAALSAAAAAEPGAPVRHIVDVRGGAAADDETVPFVGSDGEPLARQPRLAALQQRCDQAVARALAESAAAPARPAIYPDPMHNVSVEPRAHEDDVRLAYFVLASRDSAALTVSRTLRALYHPSHLFLIHVDLKANASTFDDLVAHASARANVHVLKTRRLTQWGGFSMVAAMLDALASFVHRIDFDFFVTLSDADLPLRTNGEISSFLGRFKGRAFMRVDAPEGAAADAPAGAAGAGAAPAAAARPRRHAFGADEIRSRAVIECGGYGFVSVNTTAAPLPSGPGCCAGQSGPIVHAQLPYEPPRPPAGASEYRGSQWSMLPAAFCRHMLTDAAALRWALVFERRLLPDEFYLPTVLMHSEWRHTLVNHNLRYEAWPPTDAAARDAYYASLPVEAWGGAAVLDASALALAMRSPMLFARKAEPALDAVVLPAYDPWMLRKLRGEHCADQPPIAAPLLRADPDLYGLAAPPYRAADADADGLARLTPRRVSRRRRVATLIFADGSSCSCAPDCRAVVPGGPGGPPADAPVVAGQSELPCCAHLADGRAALCDGAGGADEASALLDAATAAGDGWAAATPRLAACPVASEPLSSGGDGEAVDLVFANRAPFPTRVYHMEGGAEVPILSLRPAELGEVSALTSHAWRVRTHGGSLVLELRATPPNDGASGVSTVHIVECAALEAEAEAEEP